MLACGNGNTYQCIHKLDRLGLYTVYLYRPAGFIRDSREEDTVLIGIYCTLDMIFLEAFDLERVLFKLIYRAFESLFVKVIEIFVSK